VTSIDDLSFGEAARAFGREDIWNKVHLLLDRSVFCTRLEEVRSIRNKVMHFHPDGISDEDREILRKTRQMLTKSLSEGCRGFEYLAPSHPVRECTMPSNN
jgi:hypothetical protein